MKKIFSYLILIVMGGFLLYPAFECWYNKYMPNDLFGLLFLVFSLATWVFLFVALIYWAISEITD